MTTNSKRPRAAAGTKTPLKWTCFFEYVDKEGIKRRGKGRTFKIDNVDVELFPTGVLCGMLGRSRKCLYKWELSYGFPRALYYLEEDGVRHRWYSRKQLVAIRTLYETFGRLKDRNAPQFIAAVRRVFYTVDMPKETR